MIINSNLRCSLSLVREQNEQAYDTIIKIFESCPSFDARTILGNTLSIETVDFFNGKVGTWDIHMELDKTKKVDKVNLTFTGAHSSRTPYTENVSLSVSGLHITSAEKGKPVNIANFVISRVNNYRYASPLKKALTSKDIKEMSKREVVSKFTLQAKLDKRNQKFILSSNERFGDIAQSGEISTRTVEELEA